MTALLEIEGLTGGYNGTDVLFDISIKIQAGSIVGVLGRNGVGKTTLARMTQGASKRPAEKYALMVILLVITRRMPADEKVSVICRKRQWCLMTSQSKRTFYSAPTLNQQIAISTCFHDWEND